MQQPADFKSNSALVIYVVTCIIASRNVTEIIKVSRKVD